MAPMLRMIVGAAIVLEGLRLAAQGAASRLDAGLAAAFGLLLMGAGMRQFRRRRQVGEGATLATRREVGAALRDGAVRVAIGAGALYVGLHQYPGTLVSGDYKDLALIAGGGLFTMLGLGQCALALWWRNLPLA